MRIISSVLLIIFLFVTCVIWLGHSTCNEPPQQTNQANQTTNAKKEDCSTIHSALVVGFNRIGVYIHDFHDEIVAIGTVFIAAFTIIVGFATWALYAATRDLVRGANKTAERQLRAYVIVGEDRGGFGRRDEKLLAMFVIKNSGQTPARDVHYAARLKLLDFPLKESPFIKFPVDIEEGAKTQKFLVGPNGGTARGYGWSEEKFTSQEADAALMQHQTRRLHCFGLVRYKDVFGETRTTKFCFSIFSDAGVGGTDTFFIDFSPIDNEAD
jgi:hypothetical protein